VFVSYTVVKWDSHACSLTYISGLGSVHVPNGIDCIHLVVRTLVQRTTINTHIEVSLDRFHQALSSKDSESIRTHLHLNMVATRVVESEHMSVLHC
jgi:hypothetical protein